MSAGLHFNLKRSTESFPDRMAYICGAQRWTYAQFDAWTDQIAAVLQSWGLKKGDKVGVFLNRCIESPAAVYGILKAGGVFVPMDPHAPAQRNDYVIENVGMRFIITHPSQRFHLRKLTGLQKHIQGVIGHDPDGVDHTLSWEALHEIKVQPQMVVVAEEDPAYIMFTSGSTGVPKGIVHTHNSGMSYARLSRDLYEVSSKDVIANHSPLHFDISTFGYLTSVLAGACMVLCTDAHIKLPTSLAQLITEEKISIWYSVPLALIQMLESGVIEAQDWSSIRWILFGGEPFPPHFILSLMEHTPNATWSNVYGPAEVNQCSYFNFSMTDLVKAKEDGTWDHIPLGHIWEETSALLDEEDDGTPKKGELLIASSTQMKEYWKDPERTKLAFFHGKDGNRYYRTGDLVSRDEGGIYHFHGRIDRQVKIRGHRVELEEIEGKLIQHPLIENVIAFAKEKEAGTKMIVAAVVTEQDQISEDVCRKILKDELPSYAQPELYIFMKVLPRTTAGKVDYKALARLVE